MGAHKFDGGFEYAVHVPSVDRWVKSVSPTHITQKLTFDPDEAALFNDLGTANNVASLLRRTYLNLDVPRDVVVQMREITVIRSDWQDLGRPADD